jgi:hypothetical protein
VWRASNSRPKYVAAPTTTDQPTAKHESGLLTSRLRGGRWARGWADLPSISSSFWCVLRASIDSPGEGAVARENVFAVLVASRG